MQLIYFEMNHLSMSESCDPPAHKFEPLWVWGRGGKKQENYSDEVKNIRHFRQEVCWVSDGYSIATLTLR